MNFEKLKNITAEVISAVYEDEYERMPALSLKFKSKTSDKKPAIKVKTGKVRKKR